MDEKTEVNGSKKQTKGLIELKLWIFATQIEIVFSKEFQMSSDSIRLIRLGCIDHNTVSIESQSSMKMSSTFCFSWLTNSKFEFQTLWRVRSPLESSRSEERKCKRLAEGREVSKTENLKTTSEGNLEIFQWKTM